MKLSIELKNKIDGMSYHTMLERWRNEPMGSSLFSGESGDYFSKVMNVKKKALSDGEHVATSKRIGWDR